MSVSKIIELSRAVHVLGKAEFHVLEGSVFINGRIISTQEKTMTLYSPRSSALLEIEPISSIARIEFTSFSNGLEGIQDSQPNFGNIFEPETESSELFEQIIGGLFFLKDIFKGGEGAVLPVMRITEEWREVLNEVVVTAASNPVILVCGHRKAGKSSFSRFLLNGLLNETEKVELIDLDPGQTEFTPAGFIARKCFSNRDALLGPPFTHLLVPDDSVYLASSSPNEAPFLYCRALETLKQNAAANSKCPIIINTMGWMTGLGLEFIQYALQLFKPSHVLAFMAPEGEDTIRKCLTTNSFGSCSALSPKEAENIYVKYMGNVTNEGPRAKHSPADQRNLAFWSYFFGHIHPLSNQITSFNFKCQLSELRPVVVPLSHVQLASTAREIDLFELLGTRSRSDQLRLLESWLLMRLVGIAHDDKFSTKKGRWVNLLRSGKIKRVAEIPCIGLGFIRSIIRCSDDRIHLHVITPLPLSLLTSTNTLILGTQQLPISMLSSDAASMKSEAPSFSTQMVSTDVTGAAVRKARHNMRRK